MMFLQSSRRSAITAPRMRKAVGSPNGLLPTQRTFVCSISPKSRSLRLMLPVVLSRLITADSPGLIWSSRLSVFIYIITLLLCC